MVVEKQSHNKTTIMEIIIGMSDGSLEGNEDHVFCTDCGENWVCECCNEVILRAERNNNNPGWVAVGNSEVAHQRCVDDDLKCVGGDQDESDSESEMDVEQGGGKRRRKKKNTKTKRWASKKKNTKTKRIWFLG